MLSLKLLNSTTLVSGSNDLTMKVWSTVNGSMLQSVVLSPATAFEILTDGSLVSGSIDGYLRKWNSDMSLSSYYFGTGYIVYSISLSYPVDSSNLWVVVGSGLGNVKTYRARGGALVSTDTTEPYVGSYTYDMMLVSKSILVTSALEPYIAVYDLKNHALLWRMVGHTYAARGFELLADGTLASCGYIDYAVRVWNLNTGAALRNYTGHTGDVYSVKQLFSGYFAS